jgi:hypothetical protein
MVEELPEQSTDCPAESSDCQPGNRSTELPLPLGIGHSGDKNQAHPHARADQCAGQGIGDRPVHPIGVEQAFQPGPVEKKRLGDHPGQESGPTADDRRIVDEAMERHGFVVSG